MYDMEMLKRVILLVVLFSPACANELSKSWSGSHFLDEGRMKISEQKLDRESSKLQGIGVYEQPAAAMRQMGGTDNVANDSTTFGEAQASVTDCVTLMGKSGVKGVFSKCKIQIQEAMKFCKGAAAKETHKTACENMLVSIGIAVDECELQAEKHKKPSELCLAIVPKKKSRADCKAGQLFGQVPGNSTEPVCIDAPLDKRSKTQPLPLRLYQHWPEQAKSNIATEQNAIDVVVNTIPIGQGDCNIITCNQGRNVVIFDCGTKWNNVFKYNNNFNFILQYFRLVQSVTVLISHADEDHYNHIVDILGPVIHFRKPTIQAIVGGLLPDYPPDFLKWLVSVTTTGKLGISSTNFCDNSNIQFILRHSTAFGNYRTKNQRGLLLKLTCTNCPSQLLFPGDMEGRAATDLARNHATFLRSTHYKMAHHGASSDANKRRWLQAIQPNEVHISHIFNGSYKHPLCDGIQRILNLNTVGVNIFYPHLFTCHKPDFQAYIYHRFFSTAPASHLLCLIVLKFIPNTEAATFYYCGLPAQFV